MGGVEEVAIGVGKNLLNEGPLGWLAIAGWGCAFVACIVIVVIWKAMRESEAARINDLQDIVEASEKERIEQDRKIDRLQAVLEAKIK